MVKITAKTKDEFIKIEDELSKLPEGIIKQIEFAEYGLMGLTCTYTKDFDSKGYVLPKGTRQISYFDTYIAIYGESIFIKIPFMPNDKPFTFNINQ